MKVDTAHATWSFTTAVSRDSFIDLVKPWKMEIEKIKDFEVRVTGVRDQLRAFITVATLVSGPPMQVVE